MKTAIIQSQKSLLATIVAGVVLTLLPVIGAPRLWLLYLFIFFIYLSLANMWNLLAGYSGLICLCPAAFIGLAGYTMAILTWVGCPYYFGMILGSLVAAVFALIISFPVFRMKGIYFAIGTLVVPEILRYVFIMWIPVGKPLYGGGSGYPIKGVGQISPALTYWLALAVALISFLLIRFILRSKLGTGLAAIRDNDSTAACCGVNVFKLKLYSFVIAAFISGMAGSIFYVYQGYIEPSSAFSIQWLVTIMLITVIGGEGTEPGPIIGAIVVVFLYFSLARYAEISLIIQGVILVTIMLLAPRGILGFLHNFHRLVYSSLKVK